MSDVPSFSDLYQVGLVELRLRSAQAAAPITDLSPGSVADIDLAISAAMGEELAYAIVHFFAQLFFDSATGDNLDFLAWDRLLLQRQQDTAAMVPLLFTRPTASGGPGVVPAGTIVSTAPDATGQTVQFTTNLDVVFGPSDLAQPGAGTCTVTGPSGNVAAGAVVTISSAVFDSSLSVTSTDVASGGAAAETDDAFRARIHLWPEAQRRGSLAALQFGALTVPGVRTATAVETLDPSGNPTGLVSLFVGDVAGGSNALLIAAVVAVLDDYRAAGIPVQTIGMVVDTITVRLLCRWRLSGGTSVGTDSAKAAVGGAVANLINGIGAAGATIFRSNVVAAALAVGAPLGLLDVRAQLALGAASPADVDLQLAPAHVARSTAALISFG